MILKRAFAVPLVAVCACGGPPAVGTETPRAPTPVSDEAARQAALADSARSVYTQADVDFMAGMIHHHAQALTMSRMADDHGASEPMQILTARIINAQRDEIRLMQDWLRARGEPVPDPPEMHEVEASEGEAAAGHGDGAAGHGDGEARHGDGEAAAGHDDGADGEHGDAGDDAARDAHAAHAEGAAEAHPGHMPGMLTADQMAALEAAHGEEWDRLFLRYMIQHHEGALTMVEELFATYGAAQEDAVFKLASDIGADQSSEITRMRAMLAEMVVAEDP